MLLVGIIALAVFISLITIILTEPKLSIKGVKMPIPYWMAPLIGAILLAITGSLSLSEIWGGLTAEGSINPLKILVLFISMTTLSIFLDEAGMFRYLAGIALSHAGTSQKKLFFYLYVMVAVLTVFTSNDIIILTFTPFICYFSKNAKINPVPYLFGEFVAANTWSMMLVIGNPTNIYLAASSGITFGGYTAVMMLPTILAGLAAYFILLLIFRRDLNAPMSMESEKSIIEYPLLTIIGVIHLGLCTILLVLSSYTGMEMWLITLCFAISLFICIYFCGSRYFRYIIRAVHRDKTTQQENTTNNLTDKETLQETTADIHKKERTAQETTADIHKEKVIRRYTALNRKHTSVHLLQHTLRRAPWELIPFVLSMFLLVLALDKFGFMALAAKLLSPENQTARTIYKYGVSSFLAANIMNNIPMAVAFSAITSHLEAAIKMQAVFACIIGSNIGAFFTPLGALAGIMWSGILKRLGVSFSFKNYISLGARVSILTLLAALVGLSIIL